VGGKQELHKEDRKILRIMETRRINIVLERDKEECEEENENRLSIETAQGKGEMKE
jgi:hypothetical protein